MYSMLYVSRKLRPILYPHFDETYLGLHVCVVLAQSHQFAEILEGADFFKRKYCIVLGNL